MKSKLALLGALSLVPLSASPVLAQEAAPAPPIMEQSEIPQALPAPPPAAATPGVATPAPQMVVVSPTQTPPVAEAPQGQWIYTNEHGYIWVPAGTTTYTVEGVPYAYLYMSDFGWSWYSSPWGFGGFAIGAWMSHPWPYGYRAWGYGAHGWGWHGNGGGWAGGGGAGGGTRYGTGHFAGGHFAGGGGHFSGGGGGRGGRR